MEVVSGEAVDFWLWPVHYHTTEQLSENFVIVECNTDNIYGNDYRFGFNGMQKENELKGLGNSLDFGARVQDPRLGRFLSRDAWEKKYPWASTYSAFNNNPIYFVDPTGNGGVASVVTDNNGKTQIKISSTVYVYSKSLEYE